MNEPLVPNPICIKRKTLHSCDISIFMIQFQSFLDKCNLLVLTATIKYVPTQAMNKTCIQCVLIVSLAKANH